MPTATNAAAPAIRFFIAIANLSFVTPSDIESSVPKVVFRSAKSLVRRRYFAEQNTTLLRHLFVAAEAFVNVVINFLEHVPVYHTALE